MKIFDEVKKVLFIFKTFPTAYKLNKTQWDFSNQFECSCALSFSGFHGVFLRFMYK